MASAKPLANVGQYQLGDTLGKGGYGVVYKGLNTDTGEYVAIKQISLKNIPKDQIAGIQTEINLLKKLDHTHIVKYIDNKQTKDNLFIVIEFVENGSLAGLVKKFGGRFPEKVVASYIHQVLEGLQYLHGEGVIHRDIKGANLLSTKDGVIKLADFGVAAKMSDLDNADAVVGTPYWMAPEVIELNPPTFASDIWSVGCTTIELLTGSPPYYDLSPMPALFRIVQDPHPPIPILPTPMSQSLKEFLLLCFQKDPNLRRSATDLLQHPFLVNAKRKPASSSQLTPRSVASSSASGAVSPPSASAPIPAAAVDAPKPKAPSSMKNIPPPAGVKIAANATPRPSIAQFVEEDDDDFFDDLDFNNRNLPAPASSSSASASSSSASASVERAPSSRLQLPKRSSGTFAAVSGAASSPLPSSSLSADSNPSASVVMKRPSSNRMSTRVAVDDAPGFPDDDVFSPSSRTPSLASTSIPRRESQIRKASVNGSPASPNVLPPISPPVSRQSSQIPSPEPAVPLARKPVIAGIRPASGNKSSTPEGTPNVLPRSGSVQAAVTKPVPASLRDDDEDEDFDDIADDLQSVLKKKFHPTPQMGGAGASRAHQYQQHGSGAKSGRPLGPDGFFNPFAAGGNNGSRFGGMNQFMEHDEESEEDPFEEEEEEEEDIGDLNSKLQAKMKRVWDNSAGDDDPFKELDAAAEDPEDAQAFIKREEAARQASEVQRLLSLISAGQVESVVVDSCDQLYALFTESTELKYLVGAQHDIFPVLETLDHALPNVLVPILQIINKIAEDNPLFQETSCLVGAIPAFMRFAAPSQPLEVRREASIFLRAICCTSSITLQMFISCRGLPSIVDLLVHTDAEYSASRPTLFAAVDMILAVFNTADNLTPKKEFCRLFAKSHLLQHLSHAYVNFMKEKEDVRVLDFIEKATSIFLLFSQADTVVKSYMANPEVLKRLLGVLKDIPTIYQVKALACFKHLSMDPNTLDSLQKAGAISVLVQFLHVYEGIFATQMLGHVIQALFNLCKINRTRQEAAVVAGIVPPLKSLVESRNLVLQLALPMLCDFAHTSKRSRQDLWRNGCVEFYLQQMKIHQNWRVILLESLTAFLADETDRAAQEVLCKPSSIAILVDVLQNPVPSSFGSLLQAFEKILQVERVNRALGASPFVHVLVHCLEQQHPDALVRVSLLRLLVSLYKSVDNPRQFVSQYSLYPVVQSLAVKDRAVLVVELANTLLMSFSSHIKL